MKEILLIILFWITQGSTKCPVSCNCTSKSVACINKGLETIPILDYVETSPVILDFSGNKLVFVSQEDFSFIKSDEVKELYLNNSEIADIGFGTFDELENLQELYLGQNYLNVISESLIEELDGMVLLDLSNNYFNGNMPTIRSESLEVLILANSKITTIPKKALSQLPNLKLLILHQNNIDTLTTDVFDRFEPYSLFIKLSFNSWKCNCDNTETFEFLDQRNFIDRLEPYQCILETNETINMFGINGAIENMSQQCKNDHLDNELQADFGVYHEVRAMVNEERRELKNLKLREEAPVTKLSDIQYDEEYEDKELDIKEMNDKDLEKILPGNCWERFTDTSSIDSAFMVIIIVTISSFLMGFTGGIIFCKILYTFRYKKLEQSSDSQVQLLGP